MKGGRRRPGPVPLRARGPGNSRKSRGLPTGEAQGGTESASRPPALQRPVQVAYSGRRGELLLLRLRIIFLGLAAASCAGGSDDTPSLPDAGGGFDAAGDAAAGCRNDLDCVDRIACSIDHCEAGACVHEPCLDCCEEGLVCNPTLGCVDAPEPCTTNEECRDAIRCTLDSCRDATFCDHVPEDGLCAA